MGTRGWGALLAITALVLACTACGSAGAGTKGGVASLGGSTTTTAAAAGGQSFQDAMLAYAQCMRDNGVDFPDPTFDANGRPQFGAGGERRPDASLRNDPNFQKARQACQSKLDGVAGQFRRDPEQQAQMRDNLLKLAQCMRDNGIDFPDPTFDANGRPQFGAGGPGSTLRSDDPKVQQARQACQQQLGLTFGPRGGASGSGGPGGGGTGAGGSPAGGGTAGGGTAGSPTTAAGAAK